MKVMVGTSPKQNRLIFEYTEHHYLYPKIKATRNRYFCENFGIADGGNTIFHLFLNQARIHQWEKWVDFCF